MTKHVSNIYLYEECCQPTPLVSDGTGRGEPQPIHDQTSRCQRRTCGGEKLQLFFIRCKAISPVRALSIHMNIRQFVAETDRGESKYTDTRLTHSVVA